MENIYTVGKWFLELEKRNECCLGITGIYDENKNLETRLYHHARYDGISVFLSYLKELKLVDPARHLPKIPSISPSGSPKRLFSFYVFLITSFIRPSPRKMMMAAQGWPRQPVHVEKTRIAWRIIDEAHSKNILELTKKNKLNLNSYMLSKLIRNLGPIWSDKNRKISIGIPVSLHNDIKVGAGPTNRFSFIDIRVDESTELNEIENQINDNLKRGVHFFNWICYNSPRYIGTWIYDYGLLFMGYHQKRNLMFSNLGSWSAESKNAIFTIAPVFHFIPVSATIMSWGKKISLAMQIHPHMDLNIDTLEDMMDGWSTDLSDNDDISYWASSRTIGSLNKYKIFT